LSDDLIFGIVYIPPEGSSYLSPDAFDQVENEYRVLSQNYKYICLLGDFNSRTATINRLLPLQSSSKILPDLFLPASILFLFRSIFSVSKIAKSFSTNWVKSSS
jgi:hypothetical protein